MKKSMTLEEYMMLHKDYPELDSPIDEDLSLCIMKKVCEEVGKIHRRRRVHQCISPQNILLNLDNWELESVELLGPTYSIRSKKFVLVDGMLGYSDMHRNYEKYKVFVDDEKKRGKLRLLDFYSMGAVLAYMNICKYEKLIKEDFPGKLVEFLAAYSELCIRIEHEANESDEERMEIDKINGIYSLIRILVSDNFYNRPSRARDILSIIKRIMKEK